MEVVNVEDEVCASDSSWSCADGSRRIGVHEKWKYVVSSAGLGSSKLSRVWLLVTHLLILIVMVVATGVAMHRFESPRELARIREQSHEMSEIEELFMNKMFTFFVVPYQGDESESFPQTISAEQRCVKAHAGPKSYDWCEQCASDLGETHGAWILEPGAYASVKLVNGSHHEEEEEYANASLSSSSSVGTDDATNTSSASTKQKWVACSSSDSFTEDCVLTCALKLPSAAQVLRCKTVRLSYAYYTYDRGCLEGSGAACPNCAVLARQIFGFSLDVFATDLEDPRNVRFPFWAHLYVPFKRDIEHPIESRDWSLRGSYFFAATLLSTVGYGNFSPESHGGRVVVVVVIVPFVCVFGLVISNIASLLIGLVQAIARRRRANRSVRLAGGRSRAVSSFSDDSSSALGEQALGLRRLRSEFELMDANSDGRLTLPEIIAVMHKTNLSTLTQREAADLPRLNTQVSIEDSTFGVCEIGLRLVSGRGYDRSCSGKPQDTRELLELSIVRIGDWKRTVVTSQE